MGSPSIEHGPEPESEAADLADEVVTISRVELDELRALARGPRASSPVELREAASAASGREEELTRELAARDRRVTDLDSAYRQAIRDRELATTLAGKPLVSGAVGQLIKLWRDEFDVYEESGEYKVAARDGRTPAQWVGERLAGPEYAHFCLPSSRGGAGSKGLSRSGATEGVDSGPRTLGEAVVSQWRESTSARPAALQGPAGWGRRG
jgi:hypothetical protein